MSVKLVKVAWFLGIALVLSTSLVQSATAAPIIIPGTIISPGHADFIALRSVFFGPWAPADPRQTGGAFVAFDLSSLPFDPTAVLLVDDGVPLGNDLSALSGSGIDVDMAGGFAVGGGLSFATSVHAFVPGQRISGTGSGSAELLDAFIAANPAIPVSTAAPGGTGGSGPLFGTGASTLGSSDGFLVNVPGPAVNGGGYLAIGSGGQLSLNFLLAINRHGNIGGTIYDFLYFDVGGAGDDGFVVFDDEAIAPIPEPGTWLLTGMGLAFFAERRRRNRRA
jgi:hypothetical protein